MLQLTNEVMILVLKLIDAFYLVLRLFGRRRMIGWGRICSIPIVRTVFLEVGS